MRRYDLFEFFPGNRRALTLTAAVEAVDKHHGDVLRASALDVVSFYDGLNLAILEDGDAGG